jgi:hypothetical protein
METTPLNPPPQPAPLVWWLIWGAITAAFFAAIGIFEFTGLDTETPPWLSLAALPLFAASAAVRFLLLPRATILQRRFIFFILGLALAESGGFIAILINSPWKTPLTAAAIVLMILHIPAFIRRSE